MNRNKSESPTNTKVSSSDCLSVLLSILLNDTALSMYTLCIYYSSQEYLIVIGQILVLYTEYI